MSYEYWKKGTINQAFYTGQLFKKYVREGVSFNSFQRDMMHRGISYKRLDMLKDWNRAKAIETSLNRDSYARAERWYDKIAMAKMKERGLTPTEFFGWVQKGKGDMFETMEEQEEWLDFEDEVEEEFPERYEEVG